MFATELAMVGSVELVGASVAGPTAVIVAIVLAVLIEWLIRRYDRAHAKVDGAKPPAKSWFFTRGGPHASDDEVEELRKAS